MAGTKRLGGCWGRTEAFQRSCLTELRGRGREQGEGSKGSAVLNGENGGRAGVWDQRICVQTWPHEVVSLRMKHRLCWEKEGGRLPHPPLSLKRFVA